MNELPDFFPTPDPEEPPRLPKLPKSSVDDGFAGAGGLLFGSGVGTGGGEVGTGAVLLGTDFFVSLGSLHGAELGVGAALDVGAGGGVRFSSTVGVGVGAGGSESALFAFSRA